MGAITRIWLWYIVPINPWLHSNPYTSLLASNSNPNPLITVSFENYMKFRSFLTILGLICENRIGTSCGVVLSMKALCIQGQGVVKSFLRRGWKTDDPEPVRCQQVLLKSLPNYTDRESFGLPKYHGGIVYRNPCS